jgi:hypothetical protein
VLACQGRLPSPPPAALGQRSALTGQRALCLEVHPAALGAGWLNSGPASAPAASLRALAASTAACYPQAAPSPPSPRWEVSPSVPAPSQQPRPTAAASRRAPPRVGPPAGLPASPVAPCTRTTLRPWSSRSSQASQRTWTRRRSRGLGQAALPSRAQGMCRAELGLAPGLPADPQRRWCCPTAACGALRC